VVISKESSVFRLLGRLFTDAAAVDVETAGVDVAADQAG
jgi:hypothetical protein